jgi:hypothetical protein
VNQRFLELSTGRLIDLSQVESVSPLQGDPSFRRFTVQFRSGLELTIYQSRPGVESMKREEFVGLLLGKSSISNSGAPG